jgi:4-hydroxybenzoate-CoA ligase/benzoate-CoA ligase
MRDVLSERDGVYRYVGRSDELFKVDARWVSPPEVEAVLVEHADVAEAAVVGLPDERGLLRPAAFVVLAGGASSEGLLVELRRHVAHRLEPHQAPQELVPLAALPRLPSGKVDRRVLRGQQGILGRDRE